MKIKRSHSQGNILLEDKNKSVTEAPRCDTLWIKKKIDELN